MCWIRGAEKNDGRRCYGQHTLSRMFEEERRGTTYYESARPLLMLASRLSDRGVGLKVLHMSSIAGSANRWGASCKSYLPLNTTVPDPIVYPYLLVRLRLVWSAAQLLSDPSRNHL